MRTLFAFLSLFTIFGVAAVNSDDTTSTVESVEPEIVEVIDGDNVRVRLPSGEIQERTLNTGSIHIDEELQERIDSLDDRVSALEEQTPQIGRIDAVETQLATVVSSVSDLATVVEELQDQIVALTPVPVIEQAEEIEQSTNWASESNPHYILFFTTTNCPQCDVAKAEVLPWLRDAGWKVQEFPPDDPAASLYQVTLFPTWIALVNGQEANRWTGANKEIVNQYLRDTYTTLSETQPEIVYHAAPVIQQAEPSLRSWIRSNSDAGDWTYPGNIRSHLLDHGWSANDLAGLSTSEMVELHDATHEGRISPNGQRSSASNGYRSTRATSYSNCPSGNCGGFTVRQLRAMNRRNR